MSEKKVVDAKKMTASIIGSTMLWGFVFSILYSILYTSIVNFITSTVWICIIAIVLSGVMYFFSWKLGIKDAFKKKTVPHNLVPNIMKNLVIYAVICCILSGVNSFLEIGNSIEELEEEINNELWAYELFYSDSEAYKQEKAKVIEDAKNELYTFWIVLEIGTTAAYMFVLKFAKKDLLKYALKEETVESVMDFVDVH